MMLSVVHTEPQIQHVIVFWLAMGAFGFNVLFFLYALVASLITTFTSTEAPRKRRRGKQGGVMKVLMLLVTSDIGDLEVMGACTHREFDLCERTDALVSEYVNLVTQDWVHKAALVSVELDDGTLREAIEKSITERTGVTVEEGSGPN